MDASDIVIETQYLLDNTTGPVAKVTDDTDYAGLGIDASQVKGNVVAKYGSTIFHGDPDDPSWTAPDITRSLSDNVSFFLPLDTLEKVINAAYVFIYIIQVLAEDLFVLTPPNIGAAGAQTTTEIDATISVPNAAIINAWLTDPNKANLKVEFYVTGSLQATSDLVSVTTASVIFDSVYLGADWDIIDEVRIIGDSIYEKEFTYDFENATPEAVLAPEGSCLYSNLTVRDETNYPANLTSSTRVLQIQYPRYLNGSPVADAEQTSIAALTIGPNIWTGNYTLSVNTQITYTQEDGLIVRDTVTGRVEYNMDCSNSLCSLAACISSLRSKWREASLNGSRNATNLKDQNDYVTYLVRDYNIAISCGNAANATAIANELGTYLRQECGCDCGCGDQTTQQGEPRIIYATLTSTVTSNLLSWN